MNQKNIKKHLDAKIESLIKSIEDPKIAEILRENIIVTGGAIGSLIMGEKVNDYDFYLKTKTAVKEVAEYYISRLPQSYHDVEILDGKDKDQLLKDNDLDLGTSVSQKHIALKNLTDDRIRVYVPVKGSTAVEYDEGTEIIPYSPAFLSANCISLHGDVQIILRFYGNAETIHKNFDFVHATNSYSYSDRKLDIKETALMALVNKELLYIGSKYPITSIVRTRKFINRGYSINVGTYLKMCYQISKLDLEDVNVLEEQLFGVDIVILEELVARLKEKSEFGKITFEVISEIITECFDHNI